MKTNQTSWNAQDGWTPAWPSRLDVDADLVLVFGSASALASSGCLAKLTSAAPHATVVGCTTAGEICDTRVTDDTVSLTAIDFEHTRVAHATVEVLRPESSFEAGQSLGASLPREGLVHVFVLSDGLNVNGSELVTGLAASLAPGVSVTGGLSGDGDRFQDTAVIIGDRISSHLVVAVGLYGDALRVGYASLGGWDPFGPERLVTRSVGNVLYELDGRSALDLYKQYLGDHASGLPATGLLFPLSLRTEEQDTPVVRTILAVDEEAQSMTFAGDLPEGSYARFMKANFDRLIDGAAGAARTSDEAIGQAPADVAILISCVGRKMVLRQRIEEEVESVREVLGEHPALTGFYSYGEISPFTPNARCELHNQTMTITTLSERAA